MSRVIGSIVTLLGLLPAVQAFAACNVSADPMPFGVYDVFDPVGSTSIGSIMVSCDEAPPPDVTIAVGPSLHSGQITLRQMKNASSDDRLSYNLFIDAGGNRVWGDGTSGGSTVFLKNVTRNKPRTVPLYGILPPGQDVSVGQYTDHVDVTINW
ncbi:MAG: spore coat U domain-containing protein [Granulosicoccaceae bacterium]